jgi:transcriptional regulator with XRE-family HTH domain
MSLIGKNIKKIRSVKKMNQQDFADMFELKRASIGAYEEGRADPKIKVVIEIAKNFGISLDDFLQKELTVNDLAHFDLFKDGLTAKVKHNLKPSTTTDSVQDVWLYSPANLNDLDGLKSKTSSRKISLPTTFVGKSTFAFQVYQKESNVTEVAYEDIVLASEANLKSDGIAVLVKAHNKSLVRVKQQGAKTELMENGEWRSLNDVESLLMVEGKMTKQLIAESSMHSEILSRLDGLETAIKKGR